MQLSDQEQKQLIKDWWKKYGNAILAAILFFALANFAWQYWQQYQYKKMESSSLTYMQMLGAIEHQKPEEAKLFAKHLMDDYSRTPYASLAAFMLAKQAVEANDLNKALEQFKWVLQHSSIKAFVQIARLRAARVLLGLHKPEDALKMVDSVEDAGFIAAVDEVKGDVLVALGKNEEAAKLYKQALELQKGETKSPLLQLKLQQF